MTANSDEKCRLFPSMPQDQMVLSLLERFGELMKGRDLAGLLGFGSDRSFARAAASGQLPIPVFRMKGRRGWFARTRDVAAWLNNIIEPNYRKLEMPCPGSGGGTK